MQCPGCAQPLPANGNFCLFCGLRINPPGEDTRSDRAPTNRSINLSTQPQQVMPDNAGHASTEPVLANFALREFSTSIRPNLPPAFAPHSIPPHYAQLPLAQPMPYLLPNVAYSPPMRVPPAMIAPSAPLTTQRKRRGRSVGCIVLYAFIAIALLFTGLGFALHEIGSHVLGSLADNHSATAKAAMQMYQQVTNKAPDLQDPLSNVSSPAAWNTYEEATYGCTLADDGLHAHISDSKRFIYCLNTLSHFANVAFQVQMQILSGNAGGLVFRASTNDNKDSASLYFFQISSNGSYRLDLDQNIRTAQGGVLASGITQALDTQTDQINTLTVIAKGSTFNIYINQQFVVQVQNTSLQAGSIGVLASEDTAPTDVVYTNAKIWDLDKH